MTTPTTAEELVKALQQRVHNSMTGWEGDPLSMGEAVALVNAYTATKRTSPAGLDHPSQLHRADDTITVELWYPEAGSGNATKIEVGLVHVRSADNIQVSYDFDRDGWVIKQASRFVEADGSAAKDPDWQEVAFVQAWAREVKPGDSVEESPQPTLNHRIRNASDALCDAFCSELDHGQEQPRMRDELCQVLVDLMDVVEQTGMDGILTEAHDKLKAMEFVERRKR